MVHGDERAIRERFLEGPSTLLWQGEIGTIQVFWLLSVRSRSGLTLLSSSAATPKTPGRRRLEIETVFDIWGQLS
jgi:hypothetical protein